MRRGCGLVFGVLALLVGAHPQGLANTGLDLGYRQLYNGDFPVGPPSNAAAYLFAEMDRLHILQSQFFTEDHRFLSHGQGVPDPAAAAAFAANLSLSRGLAAGRLRAVPGDQNAHFSDAFGGSLEMPRAERASPAANRSPPSSDQRERPSEKWRATCDGLDADYQVLIQDHALAALRLMKDGQSIADRLLVAAPDDYDAELALGMENYVWRQLGDAPSRAGIPCRQSKPALKRPAGATQRKVASHLGLEPAPIRWLLRLDGAAANQGRGVARLATVQFEPADTSIHFTLGAFLHTVHGTMPLASGQLQFDPASGAASGRIVIDAAQAETGNAGRDRNMRHDVLESDQFPQIVFTPSRISPTPAPSGDSTVTLQGTISIAGGEHPISFPARVHIAGGVVTASASFPIDYVAWGLHNPSTLLLRVGNIVQVAIETRGTINWPR